VGDLHGSLVVSNTDGILCTDGIPVVHGGMMAVITIVGIVAETIAVTVVHLDGQ
jgi:hypothetical protein